MKTRIKGFDRNLKCRGFQFEIGKEYKIDSDKLELCSNTVFHYCDNIQNVNEYYEHENNSRYCEIEVLGEEITDGEKYGSNHIRIIREIVGEELDILLGKINDNTGIFNTGCYNSGNYNSGNCNSGNNNSGNYNSGDYNSGNYNSGDYNSGNYNIGYQNSGNYNSNRNNSGSNNSGHHNSGYYNSGDYNSGNCNSGNFNTGHFNSGYCNSGNCNTGYFNSCDHSNGIFNLTKDDNIRIFNKPSGMSFHEFERSKYYEAMISSEFVLTKWVEYTDEEKKESERKALDEGYLKTYSYKEACENWWNNMTNENKKIIMSMPNFNAKIFKMITGIEV